MRSYIVETYVPRGRGAEVATARRAREAARALAAAGRQIRFLRSTFLPSDELCFLVFEAESKTVVSEAAARAAIEFERIIDAVE
jgi:hypothetical protein